MLFVFFCWSECVSFCWFPLRRHRPLALDKTLDIYAVLKICLYSVLNRILQFTSGHCRCPPNRNEGVARYINIYVTQVLCGHVTKPQNSSYWKRHTVRSKINVLSCWVWSSAVTFYKPNSFCDYFPYFKITLKTLHRTPQAVSTSSLVLFQIKQRNCQVDHWELNRPTKKLIFMNKWHS